MQSEHQPLSQTMPLHGFDGILRACRPITAHDSPLEQGAAQYLIQMYTLHIELSCQLARWAPKCVQRKAYQHDTQQDQIRLWTSQGLPQYGHFASPLSRLFPQLGHFSNSP